MEDLGEEVAIPANVHKDASNILVLNGTKERDDIGVSGGKLMETDLAVRKGGRRKVFHGGSGVKERYGNRYRMHCG